MVEGSAEDMQWEGYCSSSPRHGDRDRCFHLRMDNVSALTYVIRMGENSLPNLDEGSVCTLGLVSPTGNHPVSLSPARSQ